MAKSTKKVSKRVSKPNPDDKLGFWGGVWSFLIPPVGVFKYSMNKDDKPKKAATALTVAGVSVVLMVAGTIMQNATGNRNGLY